MDPEKKKFYFNLVGFSILNLVLIILLALDVYDAFVVKKDPFQLFEGHGRFGFLVSVALFIVILAATYAVLTKRFPIHSSLKDASQYPEASKKNPVNDVVHKSFSIIPVYVLNYVTATFVSIALIGTSYAEFHSLSFTLLIVVILIGCYGIVRLLTPPRKIRGLVFSMIAIFVVFFVELIGSYLIVPDFSLATLPVQIIAQPFPLLFAFFVIGFFIYKWISTQGINERKNSTDSLPKNSGIQGELILRAGVVLLIAVVLFFVLSDKNSHIYEASTPVNFTIILLGVLFGGFCISFASFIVYLGQFIHPLTESEYSDSLQREIIISLPCETVFDLCRDSLSLLPRLSWKFHNKTAGTLEVRIWHQATIKISLTRMNDHGTKVIVKGTCCINLLFPEYDIFTFPFLRRRRTIRDLDAIRDYLTSII